MARCAYCRVETELFSNGVSVCVQCTDGSTQSPQRKGFNRLSGIPFRLRVETCGVERLPPNRQVAINVPAGSILRVKDGSSPLDKSMVVVLWAGRELAMFAEDLETRGDMVASQDAS